MLQIHIQNFSRNKPKEKSDKILGNVLRNLAFYSTIYAISSSIHREMADVQSYKIMVLNARWCVKYRKKPWIYCFRILKITMKHSGI